jgi:hypothetical protein
VRRVLALCRLERRRDLARTAGFDPDQPRDEQGRWTDTGGGEGGGDTLSTELSSAQRGGGIPRTLWNLTVRQFVSRYCQGKINQKLPGEFFDVTIEDLIELKKGGDAAANRCYKLLNQQRFRK